MELISAFFQGLWNNLSLITIPILECSCTTFIIGLILIVFILECVNKILSKENLDFRGK